MFINLLSWLIKNVNSLRITTLTLAVMWTAVTSCGKLRNIAPKERKENREASGLVQLAFRMHYGWIAHNIRWYLLNIFIVRETCWCLTLNICKCPHLLAMVLFPSPRLLNCLKFWLQIYAIRNTNKTYPLHTHSICNKFDVFLSCPHLYRNSWEMSTRCLYLSYYILCFFSNIGYHSNPCVA